MKLAYLSTYGPRLCGLATFNKNLLNAISINNDKNDESIVIALNDSDSLNQYDYPDEVKFVIRQENQKDYIRAANYVNTSLAEAIIVEHEYGIFGGQSGVYILPFVARLKKPLIVVCHTVLKQPDHMQLTIMREIARYASKVVVMSKKAVELLETVYGISKDNIQVIEHGVPDFEVNSFNRIKSSAQFKDKKILLTFGLIGRSKGLETVIKALPAIVEKHPDVVYVVLGNTHPTILKNVGEEYRDSLKKLSRKLNVEDHLVFLNKFVTEEELLQYLTGCDVYVTPYLNEEQITSGTLSYAVGAGAAVVSTPYWHASELLSEDRGVLFNFKDSAGLAESINELLENDDKISKLKSNAFKYGLNLRWSKIGFNYLQMLESIVSGYRTDVYDTESTIIDPEMMPPFDLAHISRLTDDTGIVQHAKYGIPNLKEGYCLDDNARALILATISYKLNKSKIALSLLPVYLSYIQYMQLDNGNFRNFLSFSRNYLDEVGSEDSFGRTIWSLGYLINNSPNNSYKEFAKELFYKAIPHFSQMEHLHGIANTLVGVSHYLKWNKNDTYVREQAEQLAIRLKDAYSEQRTESWHWFKEKMTYDNGIFPLALLCYFEISEDYNYLKIAIESLEFLTSKTVIDGYLNPVGNDGWLYKDGSAAALYDQQAIETMASVLMYYKAYLLTKDREYLSLMNISYQWFMGENSLNLPLYDYETKGCGDGLKEQGVNRNQGAESTLAYWISHVCILEAHALEYQYANKEIKNAGVFMN